MDAPPARSARLVLVTPAGDLLGVARPFDVATPWWQEAEPVVTGAHQKLGIDVTVLRLLEADRSVPHGGLVTYLVETDRPPRGLEPWGGALDDHPRRAPWARPGGPRSDIAWADELLSSRGLAREGRPVQIRSWNLSSLWRLPLVDGNAWLKHVPIFFRHEGALLERLAGGPVPTLLGHEGGRMLMAEIPGDDLYDAPLPALERMVAVLVGLQAEWTGRVEELVALGLADWRGSALTKRIADVVERTAADLSAEERSTLTRFVRDLPERFRRVEEAGLPETLVHGDFHPGNTRGDATSLVLLDWGDSGVGHPLLDAAAFLTRIPPNALAPIRDRWRREWHAVVPGSDPDRAADLLAPIAAARQAVIYRTFLDGIEPSEYPYHAGDPADWLGRTAALVRLEKSDRPLQAPSRPPRPAASRGHAPRRR